MKCKVHGVRKGIAQHATKDGRAKPYYCAVAAANRLVERFDEYNTRVKIQ